MHVYCLFCETQRCRQIAAILDRDYGYRCICPQIVHRKWIKGVATEETHDWLPGYIFLYVDKPINPRFKISGIIRCLGNGELSGPDLSFAEMLYRRKGVMGQVPLLQEGDRCIVADPSWQDMLGTVVKLDRGRKRCCLEFEFDEIKRTIWVGYEMVQLNDK